MMDDDIGPPMNETDDSIPQPTLVRQYTAMACTSGEFKPMSPPAPVSVLMIGSGIE